jgi:hypothetical protein
MKLNYFFIGHQKTLEECLRYEGIELNQVSDYNQNVDFISFEGFQTSLGVGIPKSEKTFVEQLIQHPSFNFSKQNPNIPILFFHEHEMVIKPVYDLFIKLVSKELGIEPRKIIIYDSGLIDRENCINPPILSKIRQYRMSSSNVQVGKTKKFSFLNNRSRVLRLQTLDKILKVYDNDLGKLKNENIITFRNYDNETQSPSNDLTDLQSFIVHSRYYRFHNNFHFYKNIELPWIEDDFKIGHSYHQMYKNQHIIYSNTYFSIIPETEYWYLDLEYESDDLDYLAFSEKSLIALSCGNLPFVVHHGKYYKRLESAGFDFSYLKTVFDIDYKENNLRQNFESIDKFVYFLKNNTIETIEDVYTNLTKIVENNKNILKIVENKQTNTEIIEFFTKIKNEKYE